MPANRNTDPASDRSNRGSEASPLMQSKRRDDDDDDDDDDGAGIN